MNTFQDTVKRISTEFLKEAKQSPQLLSDMAKMEYYMAESYSGRVFIELLQNADDAKSTKIVTCQDEDNLYFANNGKPFDEQDLMAISRSGASGKERGKTIGYRGVGFKSASSISDEIIIYSNNTYFTFSKKLCSEMLGISQKDVPTIRIPILIEDVPYTIKENVEKLSQKGFSTVFVFRNANTDLFLEELGTIDSGHFLFLNHISACNINVSSRDNTTYLIDRHVNDQDTHIVIRSNDQEKEWMVVKENGVSVAFLIEQGIIVPCSDSDAVYHCYLPTLDRSIISCKINADFSTDPSRKHITFDDKTKNALKQVSNIFINVFSIALQNTSTRKYKNLFSLFLKKTTFSKLNYFLDAELETIITGEKWLLLSNGEKISPVEYKLFPYAFDLESPTQIRRIPSELSKVSLPSEIYENIDNVDEFLSQFSHEEFSLNEIIAALSSGDFVEKLNVETHTQLITNVVREAKIKSRLTPGCDTSISKILIRTDTDEVLPIKKIAVSKKSIAKRINKELTERLGNSEIQWLEEKTGIKVLPTHTVQEESITRLQDATTPTKKSSLVPHISKWRDAESKCIEIEELWGNKAIDVSVKNVGYDILSTTPNGAQRYIEVKSVKKDFAFSLTNNEYTAAHEYGDDYYVCLLCENENQLEVRYIKNPLKYAKFEKRIRQWEWVCLEFNSTIEVFDIS